MYQTHQANKTNAQQECQTINAEDVEVAQDEQDGSTNGDSDDASEFIDTEQSQHEHDNVDDNADQDVNEAMQGSVSEGNTEGDGDANDSGVHQAPVPSDQSDSDYESEAKFTQGSGSGYDSESDDDGMEMDSYYEYGTSMRLMGHTLWIWGMEELSVLRSTTLSALVRAHLCPLCTT